jgi:hypothetical protein
LGNLCLTIDARLTPEGFSLEAYHQIRQELCGLLAIDLQQED